MNSTIAAAVASARPGSFSIRARRTAAWTSPAPLVANVPLVPSVAVHDDLSFEQWVAKEGGPEAVVAIVEELRQQAAEGSLPGFTDKDEFLAHLERRGRRSA